MESQIKALHQPLQQLLSEVKVEHCVKKESDDNQIGSGGQSNGVEYRKPLLPPFLSRPMRVMIAEMIPTIMISDGHNLIEAVLTKECIFEYRKNFSHLKFSSLKDKILLLNKWSLLIESVDSTTVYNSFNNLTIKIVVESFKPLNYEMNHRHGHL